MGGVETHCEELYPRIAKLRPNDTIVIIARRAYVPETATEYKGLRILPLPHIKGRHLEAVTSTLYGLLYSRFALNSDLLHIHGIGPALFAPLARALHMKVIVTYHSKNYTHTKWSRFERVILRIGELCALLFADRVIAISDWLATDLKQRFSHQAPRISFIPNGANHISTPGDVSSKADVLRHYKLVSGEYIIAVGRLVPEKGFHLLLDAFTATNVGYKLVIVGDADHKDQYYSTLLSRADENILFVGFVQRERLRVLLEDAALFVLPSFHEGLPIAALEAITAGTPVVLSDITPNLDLRLPSRNYFRCGDVRELQVKLATEYTSFHVDADPIIRRYDWESIAAETAKIYMSLEGLGKTVEQALRA